MKTKEQIWLDSGYDCDHCGGEILRQKGKRPVRPQSAFYRCQTCGCEWTMQGDVVHIGTGEFCREAQSRRLNPSSFDSADWWTRLRQIPGWAQIIIGLLLLIVFLRFGGFMVLRLLFVPALIGLIVYLVFRYGREQLWW
ncbi:MAG: hypothetical protein IPG51_02015 [Chloroflexi bacterium]|nr:hypothetical protein [Chloroflexota bacterium]